MKIDLKSLASRPLVLENWPVLGSRTALFFELLKERLKNSLENVFQWRLLEKYFVKTFFFWRALALVSLVLGLGLEHSCPWPRECMSSKRLSLALALPQIFLCPWPWPRVLCPRLHICYLNCILIQTSTKNCNFKFEPQICQKGWLFYRHLFNSVKLVIFCSFFAWQHLRQRSDHQSNCSNVFFPLVLVRIRSSRTKSS